MSIEDLADLIKVTALQTQASTNPSEITFGLVKSVAPLEIKIKDSILLDSSSLFICESLTHHKKILSMNHTTEETSCEINHSHRYVGEKEFTFHAELKQGDIVLLIRVQGGQEYIIVDRIQRAT